MMKQRLNNFILQTRNHLSLRRTVFIMLIHAIVPAIFGILYLNLGQRQVAINSYRENLLQIVKFAANSYDEELLKTKHILSFMSRLPEIKTQDGQACEAIAKSVVENDIGNVYTLIGAMDEQGNVYCTQDGAPQPPVNSVDRDFFISARENKAFSISSFIETGRVSGKKVIVASYPVLGEDDQFLGITFASIEIGWLSTLAKNVALPSNYSLGVVDKEGVILTRYPDTEKWISQNISQTPFGNSLLTHDVHEGIVESEGLGGTKKIYAYSKLDQNGNKDHPHIYIAVPQGEMYNIANQSLLRDIIITTIVVLVSVFILAFDWYWIISKQIQTNPQ